MKPLKEYRRDNRLAVEAIHALEGEAAMLRVVTQLRHPVRCPVCRGHGEIEREAGDWWLCATCNRHGLVYPVQLTEEDLFFDHLRPCFNQLHSGWSRSVISCTECRAEVWLLPRAMR